MKNKEKISITKEEFKIPLNAEFKFDENSRKYYINESGEKVIILDNGTMVESLDKNQITFYHIINGEYFKHVYFLKDKKQD